MTDETQTLEQQIAGFEKTWKYDASYMRHLLRAGPDVLKKFQGMTTIVDPKAAPREVIFTVQSLAVLDGDCEPCLQLGVDIALASGVGADVVRAVLTGDEPAMSEEVRLAYRFARASLAKDVAGLEPLRREVLERWGDKGLTAIALAITVGRMYPTLKYPLGYGHHCEKVTVKGETIPLRRHAAAA